MGGIKMNGNSTERRKGMVTGFDHVHIFCGDMEKAKRFFEDFFGGKEVFRGETRGYPMIKIAVTGGITVNIFGVDSKKAQLDAGKGNRGLDHVGFKATDLERTVEEMKKKGIKVTIPPTVSPTTGTKYAFIEGPDGMVIELVEK
jgi:catechol 2,3-dioxygenase-like lactoylglutathione lyase family enzyme